MTSAAKVVADAVIDQPMEDRINFLKDLIAYAAGGLCAIEDRRTAFDALYRVADAIQAGDI